MKLATDTWDAPDFSFSIYSPIRAVPDPKNASGDELKSVVVPAVVCELTVDNTKSQIARRAVLGFTGNDPYSGMRHLQDTSDGQFAGVGQGRMLAIASADAGVSSAIGFSINDVLSEVLPANQKFDLGQCAALICEVPAGEKRTFRFAACFYREGNVTAGLDMRYLYTRYFSRIEDVAAYALDNFDELKSAAQISNALVEDAALSDDQKWMFCHAMRSYYGSTQLLEHEGEAVWVVNEGEYRMMNTFDLTVDHLFWELRQNPWAVKNQLDWFIDRYSYEDRVRLPGDKTEYPGGLSFTHDMGVTNVWSRPGFSSYEKAGLKGVFSYMTHEQLVNWLCCATVYVEQIGDRDVVGCALANFREVFPKFAQPRSSRPREKARADAA